MNIPEELKYTDNHEWARPEGTTAVIGITDYAQNSMGEIVYVELPEEGEEFEKGDSFATVESVKTASEIYLPVKGKIIETNENLADEPGSINSDPYANWIVKVEMNNPDEIDSLLNADKYGDLTGA